MKRFIKRLPLLKQLLDSRSDIMLTRAIAERQFRLSQELLVATLQSGSRYSDPKKLNRHEGQVFSQNGEDGIIAEIFSRIGSTSKTFVEFGAGDGSENNSAYLLLTGWSGYWFEGDDQNVDSIRNRFGEIIAEKRLIASREFFTAESAARVFERQMFLKNSIFSQSILTATPHGYGVHSEPTPLGSALWNTTLPFPRRMIGKSHMMPRQRGMARSFSGRACSHWRESAEALDIRLSAAIFPARTHFLSAMIS